jgi:hypothetical protein
MAAILLFADKGNEERPQALKRINDRLGMSELKLRPPKRQTRSTKWSVALRECHECVEPLAGGAGID